MALTGEEFGASLLEAAMRAKVGGGKSPLPQLSLEHTYDVLRVLLQNTYRGYVAPTQPTPETIQTQDYGACDLPDIQAHQVVVAYDTPAMADNLGQVIEGGPHAGDDISYQDISGQSSTIALGTMGSMGRRLPYISDVLKGDGTTQDYYGDQTYTSPDTGQAVSGVGHRDSRVRKPTLRMLLGEGLMFSATPPSLTDPALGGTPPSHNPRPGDPPDKYATLDLLTIGGVLSAGLTKTGGDDGNGVGVLLDTPSGLQIKANKLSILPDGVSTWIDQATGQLKAGAGGQPPIVYDAGPGIEFTQAPESATPSAALSVQAQAGTGLLPGVYSYGFAWQTDLGSTKPSPLATGTADTSNGQMVLTLPPVPTDLTALGVGSITGAVFLRTKAGGTGLYTLATEDIVSGTAPSPYTDILPDSGLTAIYQPDRVIASHLAFADANRTVPASGLSRTAGQDKKGEAVNLASIGGHLAAGLILSGGDDHNGLRLYEAMIAGARAGTLDWAVGDDGNGAAVRRDDITIGKNSADQLVAKAIASPSGSTDPVGTSTNPWGCGPNAWTPSGTTGEGPVATTTPSSTTGGLTTSPTTPPASGSYSPSTSTSPPGPGYNCAGNPPATTNYSSLTFVETDVAKYSIKTGSGFTLKSQTSDPDHGSLHVPTGAGGHNGSGFWLQYQVTVLNDMVDPETGYTGIAAQDMNYGTGASFQLVWLPLDHQWHILDGFAPGGGSIPTVQPGLTAYVAWYGDCQGYMHLLVGSSASSFTEIYKGNFAPTTGVTFGFGASGCYSSGFPRTSTSPVQDEFRISSIYCSDGVPPGTVIANFNGTSNTFNGTPGTMDANGVPITPLMGGMPFARLDTLPPILTGAFPAGETFGVTIDGTTDPSYDPATVSDLQAQASAACSGCSATGAPFYTCSGVVSGGDAYAPSLTGDHIHALKDFLDDGNMLVKGKAEIDGTVLLKSDVEMQGKFYDGDGNLYGVTSLDDSAGHKAVGDVQIILDSTSGLTGLVDPAANTYTIKGTAPGTGGGGTGGTTGGSGTGSVGSGGTSDGVGAGSGGTAQTTCTVIYDASQVVQCGSPPLPVDSYGALCTYNASTCGFLDSHGAAHDPSAPFPGGSTPSGTVPIAQCPQVTPVYAQGTGKTYYQWQGTTGSVATGASTASGPSTVVNSLNGLVGDLGLYVQNGLTIALSGTSLVLGNARPGYIGGPFHVSTDSTHGTGRLDVDGPAWFAQDVVANGGRVILHPPSAPLIAPTVNTAPGTELGVGTYLYGFTETIGGVEGSLSPVATLITSATNQRGVVSLQASGSAVTSRTIYRTPVNQTGPMGLAGTVAGNGATSWTDQVIDASLGVAPPGPATITMLDDAGLAGGTDSAPIRHLHIAVDGDDLWLPAFRHGFSGGAGGSAGGDLSGTYPNPALAQTTISGKISQAGTVASRPAAAAGNVGDTYFATDTLVLYRSSGTAWVPIAASGTGSALPTAAADYVGTLYFRTSDNTLWYCNSTPAWVQAAGGSSGSSTLAGDTDVVIASPANGDIVTYQASDAKWHNKQSASPSNSYFAYAAACLEPDAIEPPQVGTFTYTIGSAATKLLLAAWNCAVGSVNNGRLELRRPDIRLPLRGVTVYGNISGSSSSTAVFIDPTKPSYTDAWKTYYDRLATLFTLPTHYLALAAASTTYPLLPGPYGIVILHQTAFNYTWLSPVICGGASGASTNGYAFENENGDTGSTDYFRSATNLYLPAHKWSLVGIETGQSGGVGTAAGGVVWVNLPSTWSAVSDPLAPYVFRDDFLGTSLDTTTTWNRTQSTTGNVEINTAWQWCSVVGNGTWGANGAYSKTSTARASGKHFLIDVYIPLGASGASLTTTPNTIVGFSDGAGYSYSNFAHGVDFTNDGANHSALFIFENGISRGSVGNAWSQGNIYRIRITLGASNNAIYEIQGSAGNAEGYAPLGGSSWTTITPATSSSSTTPLYAGFTQQTSGVTCYVSDPRVY